MWYRLSLALWAAATFASAGVVIASGGINKLWIDGVSMDGRWSASYPTTVMKEREYLAYDASGKSPLVAFRDTNGADARWEFVEMRKANRSLAVQAGKTAIGFTLKLRAKEGPLKGWYLHRSKDGELSLVKDPTRASSLRIEDRWEEYGDAGEARRKPGR